MFARSENTVEINQKQNYNGIDLVKFLCAIMVFTIHIAPISGNVSGIGKYLNFGIQQYVCRLAVPFYFVSSGFFLFKKMPEHALHTETIKSYCFKLLRLLGIWHVLLFYGGTVHLWYLGATVVAVTLLSLCIHFRMRFRYICLLAGFLYLIGLLGDSYYGIIAPIKSIPFFDSLFHYYKLFFRTVRNGFFMGFIYVLMGAAFCRYNIRLQMRTSLLGFLASMLCLLAEVFVLKINDIPKGYNMYLFLLPATFFLFSLASSVQLKDHIIYKHLRNIGLIIYLTHMLICNLVIFVLSILLQYFGVDGTSLLYILSLFFTLAFAIFVEWLSCKEKYKWIQWLLAG